ncbi:glutathione transferase Ure2p class [Trametes coccinea BRFM310]|uniref:glutathione transferase n=1 Tax=Trametes coccinea (strain BRFM310) TaxID=1353009 RepID=A0A1Y2IJL5_TRAC3|nr:glutathione transferase Ure2p class [Trametes coccinea BRFM310]
MSQPHFTLYSHKTGPNGWKVAMVLEELGLTYTTIYLDFQKGEHKSPEHTALNPNGRVPTLIDHRNNDFVLWESNAIITYLVEKYDPQGKVSVKDFEGKMHQLQWLFFQASGQGPYFGQAGWFKIYHGEPVPSAIARYQKEILRVFGVLESVLAQRAWLVGDKCTVADLSFIPWNKAAVVFLLNDCSEFHGLEKDFPALNKWHNALLDREAVRKVYSMQDQLLKA